MKGLRWALTCVVAMIVFSPASTPARAESAAVARITKDRGAAWTALADQYFDQVYFKFNPTAGTSTGLHQYDSLLEDYSRSGGVDKYVRALKKFETRVSVFGTAGLDEAQVADRELVLANIRGTLLGLQAVRGWEKNPDNYSSGVTSSAYVLMIRRFASPDARLKSLIARERQMPAVFDYARKNLKNPPKIFTEIALEQIPGDVGFFEKDLPAGFADAKNPALKKEFADRNARVIAALKAYGTWMKNDLLKRSKGDFRLGADTYAKKLSYDEMVDVPLDRLLEIGKADLRENQDTFNRLAKELEPDKTPQQVLAELMADHPKPENLLSAFHATFDGLTSFIRDKHIIEIPTDRQPTLQNTPPFMRATTFASMDTPGPYEKVAKEAYFNVTVPDPKDPPEQLEGEMAAFNVGTIITTASHEAYPGHYVQFLWLARAPTRVRKLLGASSNAEGWAHYCEQMMLDEGYGQPGLGAKDEHESKLIRLGQLQDALLRDARFVVGIEMHTGKMSFDDAVKFFETEGYQTHQTGLVETKRGTSDPTYLYYTLGKLEILKMRDDLKAKEGAAFSLEKFHTDFMRQGYPPIKIVRHALMGDDSPTL